MSDQVPKRQNEPTMNDAVQGGDGAALFTSKDNKAPPSNDPIFYRNEVAGQSASANQVSTEDQNNEKRSTDGVNGKDVLLTNGQQNNENSINSAVYLILPLPLPL